MGRFPTGVTLLTQGSGDDTIVMTLNSLTSVSLDPMLLLVSFSLSLPSMITQARRRQRYLKKASIDQKKGKDRSKT